MRWAKAFALKQGAVEEKSPKTSMMYAGANRFANLSTGMAKERPGEERNPESSEAVLVAITSLPW